MGLELILLRCGPGRMWRDIFFVQYVLVLHDDGGNIDLVYWSGRLVCG
jgi:hypothetical protein